ncbi:MAG TPA: ATP phosphoribosyltransferase regulatory subunit, partial [Nitrospiria bacterium]|nr:ATP phosphoribosyltransferase regulatory subunit [Nitrospiria bacterium]
ILPRGIAAFRPVAVAQKRGIERELLSIFSQWGYEEVIPPIFEYLDVLADGLDEEMITKGYKVVDRGTGRLLILRPDVTPQIARMAATLMRDRPLPLRLCYSANVFRDEEEHAGRERELFQIGCELIGLEAPQADAEIIAIAIETLRHLGLRHFKLAIGQVEFFRGFLEGLRLSPQIQKKIRNAMARKESSELREIIQQARIPSKVAEKILAVPELFGKAEVLKQAGHLVNGSATERALARLEEVYQLLVDYGYREHLIIDLGEIRGFDYYTGIVFEVFAKGLGYAFGGGGRYDQMLGKFGYDCPSTGFAFDLERLYNVLKQAEGAANDHPLNYLITNSSKQAVRAFQLAKALREKGCRVTLRTWNGDFSDTIRYARGIGVEKVLLLEDQERASDEVVLLDCRNGSRKRFKGRKVLEIL